MDSRRFFLLATIFSILAFGGTCLAKPVDEKKSSEKQAAQRIERLIAQLGDADFFTRERAQAELAKLGVEAFDALCAAEASSDVEIVDRAQYLLRNLKVDWVKSDDSPDVQVLLARYLAADVDSRADLLRSISTLADNRDVPALCRIVRYERSTSLSKRAALELIEQKLTSDKDRQERRKLILAGLAESPRVGAQWLRTFLQSELSPTDAAEAWKQHVEVELSARGDLRDRTDDDLLFRILRQQALVLRQLNRTDENLIVMRRMLEISPDDENTFRELIDWLVEQKAWNVVDEAAQKYHARFENNILLLYTLAQAAEAQGRNEEAEKLVKQARELGQHPRQHLAAAYFLQLRGRFDWAEREYQLASEASDPGSFFSYQGHKWLAEMLHDQQRDADAAESMRQGVAGVEGRVNAGREMEVDSEEMAAGQARMHFFLACAEPDRDKQIGHLIEGYTRAVDDADVLIALYRVSENDPELRKKAMRWINEAANKFREEMTRYADEPAELASSCNQFAWLVANTEGDQDEALRASQKSLEIRPGTAGYIDTLARCYFAQGKVAEAVEQQSRAVTIEPHSGAMQRQLELFRKSLPPR